MFFWVEAFWVMAALGYASLGKGRALFLVSYISCLAYCHICLVSCSICLVSCSICLVSCSICLVSCSIRLAEVG